MCVGLPFLHRACVVVFVVVFFVLVIVVVVVVVVVLHTTVTAVRRECTAGNTRYVVEPLLDCDAQWSPPHLLRSLSTVCLMNVVVIRVMYSSVAQVDGQTDLMRACRDGFVVIIITILTS
jgi:hypothetical protein